MLVSFLLFVNWNMGYIRTSYSNVIICKLYRMGKRELFFLLSFTCNYVVLLGALGALCLGQARLSLGLLHNYFCSHDNYYTANLLHKGFTYYYFQCLRNILYIKVRRNRNFSRTSIYYTIVTARSRTPLFIGSDISAMNIYLFQI